jgi:tellurite resistance protein TehA-like permease
MAGPRDPEKDEASAAAADNPALSVPASQTLKRHASGVDRMGDGDGDGFEEKSSSSMVARTWTSPDEQADELSKEISRRRRVSSGVSSTATQQPQQQATHRASNAAYYAAAPSKYDVGWRRVVRNFSPSWFSVTMGTGVVSILLIQIPFQADWLYWASVAFFAVNAVLFALAFVVSVLRYTLYPEIWAVMIADSTNSLFLGTAPMGFATLISSWVFLCCPYWGPWATTLAWVCWMADSVVAVAVTVSLPFLLMSQSHQQSLQRITAAQLLPIAATIVASGTGTGVAAALVDPNRALGTIIACYVLWGMATPLALTVLVIYYQRLALHKLPPREIIVSSFLPLGPLGMGGYAIMRCGAVARTVFPRVEFFHNLEVAGDIVFIVGVFVALIMWGFGLCWLVFALASIYNSRPFPFNMGELVGCGVCLSWASKFGVRKLRSCRERC